MTDSANLPSATSIAEAHRFQIDQLIRPVVNLWRVYLADQNDQPGPQVAFVRQKRMKIREDIRVYTDESETAELVRIKSRKVFEFRGTHDVFAPDGTLIGTLRKQFGRSLGRSTWEVDDASGQTIMWAQERSVLIAVLRRIYQLIPIVEYLPYFPIPFHFDIFVGTQIVGRFNRKTALRDRYLLDVGGIPPEVLDRRLALAFGIGMDALQDR